MKQKEDKKFNIKDIGIDKLVVILLCGIVLLALSVPEWMSSTSDKELPATEQDMTVTEDTMLTSNEQYSIQLEKRLQSILKKINGIGDVEVMITVKATGEKIALKDEPYNQESLSETDEKGSTKVSSHVTSDEKTILFENEDGSAIPYILKETEPEIEGVLVIAQGAQNSTVKNEIMEAVQVLFDVSAHKIKVMKMDYTQ